MKKFKISNYDSVNTLLLAIVFMIIGIILLTNPGGVVAFLSYIIGGIIIIVGLVQLVAYVIYQKVTKEGNTKTLIIGMIAIVIGLLAIFSAKSVEVTIRLIMGTWIFFVGINRLVASIPLKRINKTMFIGSLITALVMIGSGIFMIVKSNLILQLIGMFMIIYAISEIIGYIFYSPLNKKKNDEPEVVVKSIEKKQ